MKAQKNSCPEDSSSSSTLRRFFFEQAVASGLGSWPQGTVLLVAVSGGADSTALLAALAALRQTGGYQVHGLHVDHGIRPVEERQGDAHAVHRLCNTLGVPYRLRSVPPGAVLEAAKREGSGVEEAARIFRHRALRREARWLTAARILVAHTQDDLLETVVMRFLRGSGPGGLAPMRRDTGRILRPLLGLTRREVLAYLADRGIGFRIDTTNEDIRYLRNRIRHRLIPGLDTSFPGWKQAVLRGTKIQELTADFLSAEAQRRIVWDAPSGAEGRLYTDERVFFAQPEIIREEALFQGIDRLARESTAIKSRDPWVWADCSGPREERRTVRAPRRASLRLFTQGSYPALDAGPLRIERQGACIALLPRTPGKEDGFALVVQEPGVYWFNGVKMVCGVSSSFDTGQEKPALFADLPLVFRGVTQYDYKHRGLYRLRRSGYSAQSIAAGIILEDLKGPCAFIDARIKELIIGLCRPEQAPKEQVDEALIPYEKLYREEQAKPQGIRLFFS